MKESSRGHSVNEDSPPEQFGLISSTLLEDVSRKLDPALMAMAPLIDTHISYK